MENVGVLFDDAVDFIESWIICSDQRNSICFLLGLICKKCRPIMEFGFSNLFVDSSNVVFTFDKICFKCIEVTFLLIRL